MGKTLRTPVVLLQDPSVCVCVFTKRMAFNKALWNLSFTVSIQKNWMRLLLTMGSFLLTMEPFYLRLTILVLLTVRAFLLTILAFLLTIGAFFAYSGKVRLIRALRDCKQRSLTVSKKAPTVRRKASPTPPPQKKKIGLGYPGSIPRLKFLSQNSFLK